MKLILVTGIENMEKNKLLSMAMGALNNGSAYKEFCHVNLNALDSVKNGFLRLEDMKKSYLSIYDEIEKTLNNSKRSAFNIVLDASFSLNKPFGYVPLITDRFFSIFRPDVMLIIESKLEDFRENPRELLAVRDHQEINRSYCMKFAADYGIPVKIIRVNRSEVKATIKEIQDYLTSVTRI